ncbi:nicotinate (nicotinamide) nucleotide adenylyltransferase [Spirochaetota bacterium]
MDRQESNDIDYRYALFGGSFNPPHLGHLYIAEELHKIYTHTKLIIMPCYVPPHKEVSVAIPPSDRIELIKILFKGLSWVTADTYEIEKKNISYSIETVSYFKEKKNITKKLIWVIGDDLVDELDTWKEYRRLTDEAVFFCFNREKKEFPEKRSVVFHSVKPFEACSSEIRDLIRRKETNELKKYLSEEEIRYIDEKGLY